MTMQYADVNGIRIAYDVRGSGPPLVLIMGYRLSSRGWPLDFVATLAERFHRGPDRQSRHRQKRQADDPAMKSQTWPGTSAAFWTI